MQSPVRNHCCAFHPLEALGPVAYLDPGVWLLLSWASGLARLCLSSLFKVKTGTGPAS